MLENVKTRRRYRLTNRQIKALDTKQKIYNAALVEIQTKGYLNVSIGDITEAAGVAKGSFYTHFDSKESILRYTYDQLNPIYLHAYNQVKDLDFLNSLCSFIKLSFTELEKLGKEILRAMATNYHSEEFIGVYLDHDRQIYKCLDMIISAGKINGVLSEDIPTKHYVRIIFSVLIGVENCWCLMVDDEMSLADFAVQNVRLIAMGMMDDCRERRGL
ncbi:MAG: TetR/AcrR family transcriptional regulator [Planctomycetaceae bacterium]|nr:TetR/AcrR family transcriptional regulator [Planctomycetaceae bacterium]